MDQIEEEYKVDDAVVMSTQIENDKASIVAEAQKVLQQIDAQSNKSKTEEDDSDDEDEDEEEVINFKDEHLIWNPESGQRHWLKTHGKSKFIDFEDEARKKLLRYYQSLDDDDSGSIGVDELEEPLIALGLLDSRQQVQDIVNDVDDDGSGMLEFEEFLKIIKGGQNGSASGGGETDGAGAIYQFFKGLTDGNLKGGGNPNVPFSLYISTERRRRILQSMKVPLEDGSEPNGEEIKAGEKIANNYKRSKAEQLAREVQEADGFDFRSMQSVVSSQKGKSRTGMKSMNGTGISARAKGENEHMKLISSKLQEVSQFQGEPPDPETVLGSIFFGEEGKKFDLSS